MTYFSMNTFTTYLFLMFHLIMYDKDMCLRFNVRYLCASSNLNLFPFITNEIKRLKRFEMNVMKVFCDVQHFITGK